MKNTKRAAHVGLMKIDLGHRSVEITHLPTFCPRCHSDAIPRVLGSAVESVDPENPMFPTLDVPVRCARCDLAYIAEYSGEPTSTGPDFSYEIEFEFTRTVPNSSPTRVTSPTLERLSPRFAHVYDQAAAAEREGLDEVAGTGYRRALEILLKDYLIAKDPVNREEYLKKWLAECIGRISDPTIQDLAKRANVIATDFAHYERYGARELGDLVSLIDLVRARIELNEETESVQRRLDEPEPQF